MIREIFLQGILESSKSSRTLCSYSNPQWGKSKSKEIATGTKMPQSMIVIPSYSCSWNSSPPPCISRNLTWMEQTATRRHHHLSWGVPRRCQVSSVAQLACLICPPWINSQLITTQSSRSRLDSLINSKPCNSRISRYHLLTRSTWYRSLRIRKPSMMVSC